MIRTKSWDHITPVLQSLHWLPVRKQIEYKIHWLTYSCVHKTAPQVSTRTVSPYNPPRFLHSSSLCRLSVSGLDKSTNENCSGARSCRTHPLEQAARQVPPSKKNCFFSVAAEITFVFISVILFPDPHPFPLTPIPFPMSSSTYHLPPPNPSPSQIFFAKCNEHVVFCMEPDCTLQVDMDSDQIFRLPQIWIRLHQQEDQCFPFLPKLCSVLCVKLS